MSKSVDGALEKLVGAVSRLSSVVDGLVPRIEALETSFSRLERRLESPPNSRNKPPDV
jgi:hypothetical protein